MSKDDFLELIKAWESFRVLDQSLQQICEGEIDPVKYKDLYNIYMIIKRNSVYSGSGERENDLFGDVLLSDSLSAQKKCEKLYNDPIKKYDDYGVCIYDPSRGIGTDETSDPRISNKEAEE